MRLLALTALLVTTSLSITGSASDDEAVDVSAERAYYGASGPDFGSLVLRGSVGIALILPHMVVAGRAGLGAGTYVEAGYGNLAVFGHEARGRLGWGMAVSDNIDLGLAMRTSFASLAMADGAIVGINFSSLPLGNDWEVGNDMVLTWNRPGSAHITVSVGPTFTLGGIRFIGFGDSEFQLDPSARSIDASIQSEWSLWETANIFVRLDAQFLLGIEQDEACVQAGQENCGSLVPFGFIPTGAVGVAWSI